MRVCEREGTGGLFISGERVKERETDLGMEIGRESRTGVSRRCCSSTRSQDGWVLACAALMLPKKKFSSSSFFFFFKL